jgi:hypothetical protein
MLLVVSGCAGNQAAQNALKPDARLQTNPEATAAVSPLSQPSASPSQSPPSNPSPSPTPIPTPINWQDQDKLPTQLKPYVEDLLTLNVLKPDGKAPDADRLNSPITRREFAKWLLAVNNHYYQSRSPKQIRIDRPSSTPAFQDIPTSDSDFALLQSLAEAGILPSSLSGEDKTSNFRPSDKLTREDLLRWKVPLDVRSPQTTSLETLQKSIPFQDINKLTNPESLRVVAWDLQNGDQSNLRRSLGYTKLLQPQRSVTRAEAMAALWSIGAMPEVLTAKEVLTSDTSKSPKPEVR